MDIRGEYRVMINLWFEKWTQGGSIGLALLWSKTKKLKFASSFASPEKKNYYFIFTLWLWSKKFINGPVTTTVPPRTQLYHRSRSNKHTQARGRPRKTTHIFHVCLRRLGVPPRPPLIKIEDLRTCDSDRHVTVNNIQVILVCGRPSDRGGCLGAKAQSAGQARQAFWNT
jgi:hypothetical protein